MRYFFDLATDGSFWRDENGDDIADIADARGMAAALVADLVSHHRPEGLYQIFSCDVRNASGALVYRAELEFRSYQPRPVIAVIEGQR